MNYKFSLLESGTGRPCAHWILCPPVTVGRCPTSDILINDPSISRRHCQFTLDADGALVVRDLGSKNGVYVNDERVERAIVRPGELVQIGAVTLSPEWTAEAVTQTYSFGASVEVDETQAMPIIDLDSGQGS